MLALIDRMRSEGKPIIALFEPDDSVAQRIIKTLVTAGLSPLLLPDPATHPIAWQNSRFEAIVFSPFRSMSDAAWVTTIVRGIVGDRPILALTPDDCAGQRTAVLINGADDAIHGGGDEREIEMRILALIRRRRYNVFGSLICDELEINLVSRHVARAGRPIAMPLREFDLLAHLAHSRDRAVSRLELLQAVWRIDFDPGTNRIDVHVSRLRQRIDGGQSHAMLRTVKGIGYALVSRMGAQSAMRAC